MGLSPITHVSRYPQTGGRKVLISLLVSSCVYLSLTWSCAVLVTIAQFDWFRFGLADLVRSDAFIDAFVIHRRFLNHQSAVVEDAVSVDVTHFIQRRDLLT